MTSAAILSVLSVIESFLSVLGTNNATTTLISNVINALTQLMPYIVNEVQTVYTSVKNIITQLQNSGAPTADQISALQALDAQVDAAWATNLDKFDPDNPANAGTPAGDDPPTA
jgi:hypothetical protein